MGEVVESLALHWPGFASEMDRKPAAGTVENTLLKLSCDKALAHLGWRAILSFDQTIDYTAKWYRTWHEGDSDMYAFTMSQIEDYVAIAKQEGLLWTEA